MSENNEIKPNQAIPRPYTFDRVVRIILSIVFIIGCIWIINRLRDVLLPFCVAWLIAYILEPFVQYNRRLLKLKSRIIPVFITLFECVLILIAVSIFFVPSIIEETQQLAVLVERYAYAPGRIPYIPEGMQDFLHDHIDFSAIATKMTNEHMEEIIGTVGDILSGGWSIILGFLNWCMVILYIIFIMLDYERTLLVFKRMVPPRYREIASSIGNDVKTSMNHYFRGQALIALTVGVLFSIGFSIIGLPLAVVLGLFIGLLNMVPYLQLVSLVPTTLLCMVYSANSDAGFWDIWWACMLVYVIVQCIQDLILTPRIMGKAMGLNPAIILLSLSIWGSLLGLIGLIIALPMTTLILAYYERYITRGEPINN